MIPETRLLGYRATSPRLRVVDLAAGTEVGHKLMDRAGAVDALVPRQGWLAAQANGVWWLAPDLDQPARRITPDSGLAAAIDPQCMWVRAEGGVHECYDGLADEVIASVELGSMVTILAEVPEGFLVWDVPRGSRRLVEREPPHRLVIDLGEVDFVAVSGSRSVWRGPGSSLRIIDHHTGTEVVVHDPRVLRWSHDFATVRGVSPDGSTLVLAGRGVFGPVPTDLNPKARQAEKRNDTIMVFVDLPTGEIAVAPERFQAPSAPIWLASGTHLAFASETDMYLMDAATHEVLTITGHWKRPPMPLIDLGNVRL